MNQAEEWRAKVAEDRFKINLSVLQDAKPGSDLYGVLEKTAFHLQSLTKNPDNFKNWINAQVVLAAYVSGYRTIATHSCMAFPLFFDGLNGGTRLAHYSEVRAGRAHEWIAELNNFFRERGEIPNFQFDNWMYVQDELAQRAAKSCCFV